MRTPFANAMASTPRELGHGLAMGLAGAGVGAAGLGGAALSGLAGHAGSALIGRSHSNTFKGASALPEHFVAV